MNNLPVAFEADVALINLTEEIEANGLTVGAVTEPAHYLKAADSLKTVKGWYKKLEEFRKQIVKPIDERKSAVQAWFKPYQDKCVTAEIEIKSAMLTYDREQERLRAEQERRLRQQAAEMAEKQRQELLAQQVEAMADGDMAGAEELQAKREEVKPLNFVVPEVQTPVKGLATKSTWKARVVDFAALPDKYKVPNDREIARFATLSKGETAVPGLEFYEEKQIAVRV